MIGLIFGKLTVIRAAGMRPNGERPVRAWACRCECGRERIVAETELRRGRITHCDKRRLVERGPEYGVYAGMKDRCWNKRHKDYHSYGGRGIGVCERWLSGEGCETGFECFLADMGKRSSPAHSIDRYPDLNGNYEPGNCRWATPDEQRLNRRVTRRILVDGVEMTLKDAAASRGMGYYVLLNRLDRYGMSVERALAQPVRRRREIVSASRER